VVDVPGNPGIIWKNLTHSKICWTDPEKSKQYKIIPNFAIRTMPKAYIASRCSFPLMVKCRENTLLPGICAKTFS
ncbi:MAG: hypothetical protein K9H64_21445, partial [Bacteroidales bacterium]|nr:hypothetical protein [Bacteroidales bacterium]MCF8458606.1 hypothetical protein [Bacteroidales bacterium]